MRGILGLAISFFVIVGRLPGQAPAAREIVVELDSARTQVEFSLASVLHTVHGNFRLRKGSLRLDPASGAVRGVLVVDAASGASGNDSRDRKMHKSVLESDRFPEITFAATRVEGKVAVPGNSKVGLQGALTLHGATHTIVILAEVRTEQERISATASFTVPYVEWGLKSPSTFLLRVSDRVEVTVKAVGRIVAPPAE